MSLQKENHLNWIEFNLKRPEINIGNNKNVSAELHVIPSVTRPSIILKTIEYNQAFHRIFIEIMSNAIDNKWRSEMSESSPMTAIKFWITDTSISVWNDGASIPIKKTAYEFKDPSTNKVETKIMYPAELLFGEWLSSTNYNDSEERKTSGKNGIGAKAVNIFSTSFRVEHVDPKVGKKLILEYKNNRSSVIGPKVTTSSSTGYTKITFTPDFEKFGITNITEEWKQLFTKDIYECAMITGLPVTLSLDGKLKKIKIPTLESYSALYHSSSPAKTLSFQTNVKTTDISIVLKEKLTPSGFTHKSFVNGIYTKDGGVHVNKVKAAILNPLFDLLKAKYTKGASPVLITKKNIEEYLTIFIKYECDKPEFDSQSKHRLVGPSPSILKPFREEIEESLRKNLPKFGFVKVLLQNKTTNQIQKIEKSDASKTRLTGLGNKLDDANWAKNSKLWKRKYSSNPCILFTTEGISAMNMVTTGKGEINDGHNIIGGYALRGKFVNAAKVTSVKLNANEEVSNLKKAIGLQIGKKYTKKDINSLRYGKVVILCDQDEDGHHIGGLILELFYKEYPELISLGFIGILNTPIVRAFLGRGKNFKEFYTLSSFEEFRKSNKIVKADYYKGLGTHEASLTKEIFKNLRIVNVHSEGNTKERDTMNLGFSDGKFYTDGRKKWMNEFDPSDTTVDDSILEQKITLSQYVNGKLILYHIANKNRMLPSVFDGLKECQRKILYTCFKKNLIGSDKKTKVVQLSGSVIELADYHHGETSLHDAIIKMAQNFTGSNNINILFPSGSFGTRLGQVEKGAGKKISVIGGGDSAAPRYLYTYLSDIATTIYNKKDLELLEYKLSDDGDNIEPVNYAPIIPMILVNGADGIASGWSTHINNHNPKDIIEWIRTKLESRDNFPEILPWWKGWKGRIEKENGVLYSIGVMNRVTFQKKKALRVTELPAGMWTHRFRLVLEDMQAEGKLEFDKFIDDVTVDFVIYPKDFEAVETELGKHLKKKIQDSNMVAQDNEYKTFKYTLHDILTTFCDYRLNLYNKRKEKMLNDLRMSIRKSNNKYLFIKAIIITKTIAPHKLSLEELDAQLDDMKFDRINNTFDYLTSISFKSCTKTSLKKLKESIATMKLEKESLKKISPEQLWLNDLDELEKLL